MSAAMKSEPKTAPAAQQRNCGSMNPSITFVVGSCSLGTVLVAASSDGVCAVLIGDDAQAVRKDVLRLFPEAAADGGSGLAARSLAGIVAAIESPSLAAGVPLDIRGTPFQCRVWTALQDIAPGTTASYADIANRIGAPKSVRAVARACASNRIAVLIPCHRVIRSDGSNSGYRWGVERKQALLDREARA